MKKAEDNSLCTNGRSSDIFNITFRNYVPKSTVLKERCKDAPNIKAIERQLDEDMRAAIASFQEKDPLSQLTVKKANWDLKRDVQKKLNVLARQTNAAIVQLIKMDVESTGNAETRAAAAAAATATLAKEEDLPIELTSESENSDDDSASAFVN